MTGTGEYAVDQTLDRAEVLLDVRRYDAALEAASGALSAAPEDPRAHAVACRALLGLDRGDDAVLAARQAVRFDPTSAHAFRLLSLALLREASARNSRPSDDAVSAAREAVRLAPYDAYSHTSLAEALAATWRIADADLSVRRAIAIAPAQEDVWVTASLVGIKARNWHAAEVAARRALMIDPQNYAATNNLGVALDRQGYWPLAAVAYVEAARNDPRASTARNNVEAVGFQYLAILAPLLLLPLLIVAPAFFAARVALTNWLSKKPPRLQRLALRIGLRVAGSKRRQRRFERRNARVQVRVADRSRVAQWSAVADRRTVSNGMLGLGGGGFVAFGLICVAATVTGSGDAGALIGVAFIAGGALLLHRLRGRYRIA